jgi:hypothetical protein
VKNLPLTQEQLGHLMQCLDLAVKAGGIQIAGVAYDIAVIAQSVMQQETPDVTETANV